MAAVDQGYYRTRLAFDPHRDRIWRQVSTYLQRYLPENGAVLELGSGYGSFINHLRAREKHALDIQPEAERHAAEDVTFHRMSCADAGGLGEECFDAVVESFLLEHLTREELERTLQAILRVLKPGGVLVAVQPNFATAYRSYFDDYTHRLIFTHVSLADLLTARGFLVERVQARFLPFSLKSRLPKWPLLTWLYLRSPWKPLAGNMLVVARKPS